MKLVAKIQRRQANMGQGAEMTSEKLPLLPLKDIVVFPQMILPVFVSEDICLKAVESALAKDRLLFLSAFRNENSKETGAELACSIAPPFDVYNVGTVAMVMRTRKLPDGRTKVLIQGVSKATALHLETSEPFPVVSVQRLAETPFVANGTEAEVLLKHVRELLEKLVGFGRSLSPDILMLLEDVQDPGRIADLIASNLGLKIIDAQRVLGAMDPMVRLKRVHGFLLRELESASSQLRLTSNGKEDAQRASREHFLREQLRAIKMELGELDGKDDIEEMREKIEKASMSAEGLQESRKQLKRLERMNQDSSEATITRTYLEWMVDLPWAKLSESKADLKHCQEVLEEEHYGLDKIKDRIVEYIAVKKLNPDLKGPILCFVGPPGVGKTSLGRSIANALGRKFVRISLGGVKDEAEVRGHRRTYVGSQPGRIVQALKNAGTRNPVVMLDEIDKMGSDYKGDPSSALLEVLDPEQNSSFSDHYVHVPFDLSQVIFIANANRLDTIPAPLRDRLEVIEVSGYSEEEKLEIAKRYIIPKCITNHGLKSELVTVQDSAITYVVNHYTRESGLRNLEKQFATVSRKLARQVAEADEIGKERKAIKVTAKLAKELLGEERFPSDDHDTDGFKIGVGTGLAYTSHGGEVLVLEVNLLPGKGNLLLTGQLGDVMKESAHAAFSYLRSKAEFFAIPKHQFTDYDIHLHIPAGAIPKDGPSAGIAIATALVSALKNQPVRQDVAMTGEITLHGKVLPVGGLREKLLAALRVGIKTVCVPEKNRSSISELPVYLRRRLDIRFVQLFDEVIDICFDGAQFRNTRFGGDGQIRAIPGEMTAAKGFHDPV
jgi:ATP-dependent Lon protease